MALAGESGIGMVALRNTSHWLRASTYGWRAVDRVAP
jgi:3-dehydro-L-gulonate 2-dehydrogenase